MANLTPPFTPCFVHHGKRAFTLMELLISIVLITAAACLSALTFRSVDVVKTQQSNKVTEAAILEVESAYQTFLSKGGIINDNTHITDILSHINSRRVWVDGTRWFNSLVSGTSSRCDGVTFVCYELESRAIIAVPPKAGAVNGNNGYFTDDSVAATTQSVNGITTQLMMIDNDGYYNGNSERSASVKVTLDALGRTGIPTANQPAWFTMDT
jgi:prepilin-type N-terminal cleavage/methylation domain-containing protein